jgi:hypothetical protein
MEGPASDLQLTYLRDLWGLTLSFSMAFWKEDFKNHFTFHTF